MEEGMNGGMNGISEEVVSRRVSLVDLLFFN